MKNYLSVLAIMIAALPAYGANNYYTNNNYSANNNYMRNVRNTNYEKTETRTRTRTYSPAKSNNANPYRAAAANQPYYYNRGENPNRAYAADRSSDLRTRVKRKYYLAHPFFQPTEGKFGLISDLSYGTSSYDIAFNPIGTMSDTAAKWSMKQFAIKEDLSFGITDHVGIVLMARYDSSEYKFDWSDSPDDKMDDSGLNIYGAGLQWRFVDTDEWIATASGYYQRQKGVANEAVLDLKAGYKIAKSTIYGIARGWLVDFDEDYYGNGIVGTDINGNPAGIFIAYDMEPKNTFFVEGGLGVFSVLGEDWTLNLEGIFGHYDWHNQAYVKGAFGWQPNDWFALNLYGKVAFYDTAEDKKLDFYGTEAGTWGYMGTVNLDNYTEMSFGGQVIFYF
jgi:uncharacterized protein YxeA